MTTLGAVWAGCGGAPAVYFWDIRRAAVYVRTSDVGGWRRFGLRARRSIGPHLTILFDSPCYSSPAPLTHAPGPASRSERNCCMIRIVPIHTTTYCIEDWFVLFLSHIHNNREASDP